MKTVLQVLVLLVLGFILFFLFYNALVPQKSKSTQNTLSDKTLNDISAPKQKNGINTEITNPEFTKNPAIKSEKLKMDKSSIPEAQSDIHEKETSITEVVPENAVSHSEESSKEITTPAKTVYQVDKDICIGCKLCTRICPVSAISIKNGKAVINKDKCTGCGTCAIGDGQKFKGCPVAAISTF